MVDPLSISASIVAVIQASVAVVRYLGDVKDTPHDVGKLRMEIDNLQSVLLPALRHLKRSRDGNLAPERLIEAQNGPLQELRVMLEDLEKRLAPTTGLRKARKAMTWPFRKSEIIDIVNAIERRKSLFILMLQLDQYELLQDTRLLCSKAHDDITELAETFAKTMSGYEDTIIALCFRLQCLVPSTRPWRAYQRVRAPSTLQDLLALQDASSITPMAMVEDSQHLEFERAYSRIPITTWVDEATNGRLASLAVGQHHRASAKPKPITSIWKPGERSMTAYQQHRTDFLSLLRRTLTCRKTVNARLLQSLATVRFLFRSSGYQSHLTEVNIDPALSILDTRKLFGANLATVSPQEAMAPEHNEPPPPTQNMTALGDQNITPPRTPTKTTFPKPAHEGHNLGGVNALYDGAIQTLTNTNATFASEYAYDNQRPKGKKQGAGEPAARSAVPEAQNPCASNQTADTAHRKINGNGSTHYGNNMDGVNAIYRSEQNIIGGSLSFG